MELKPKISLSTRRFMLSINRTFMELKRTYATLYMSGELVLIEPLWNWNSVTEYKALRKSLVLIEPLWNWNRTKINFDARCKKVLIEPLWNWNEDMICENFFDAVY